MEEDEVKLPFSVGGRAKKMREKPSGSDEDDYTMPPIDAGMSVVVVVGRLPGACRDGGDGGDGESEMTTARAASVFAKTC